MTGFDAWAADLARRVAAKSAPPEEGARDGEPCNRNGCKGVLAEGIVGAHGAGGRHHEVYGVACPDCEWSEAYEQ